MLWYAQGRFISNRKYVIVTTDTLVAGDKVARDRESRINSETVGFSWVSGVADWAGDV